MSESAAESSEQTPPEGAEQQEEAKTFDADYVKKLRDEAAKYRTEAKANSDAAKRLAEIEDAQKSQAEKTADRIKQLETDLTTTRLGASRFQIAAEFGLNEKQSAALAHASSVEGMRELAETFKADSDKRKKNGNHAPREGANPSATEGEGLETVRALFGS